MSQHDMNIANDIAPLVRADINNALAALVSQNSGSSAPSTTYANMIWYDTANNILKMRNEADDAWISMFYFDQNADALRVLQNTLVTDTSGTQIGILGQQVEGNWQSGTSTTESLVSPAKIKAAFDAFGAGIGVGQTWQDMSATRTVGTTYTNSTGKPIQAMITLGSNSSYNVQLLLGGTFTEVFTGSGNARLVFQGIIPDGVSYRANGAYVSWFELR